jgi:uncharacterized protein YndB with AHSA1/START domain
MEKSRIEAGSDREIVVRRTFDAAPEVVFDAFTDPEGIVRWWGPSGFTTTTEEMDVRPGGVWRQAMWGPDGTRYPNRLRYTAVERPRRLAWIHDEDAEGSPAFDVEVRFEAEPGGRTAVTLRQTHPTVEARDRVVREHGAIEGGKQTLTRLAALVETGDPAEAGTVVDAPSDTELRVVRWFDAPRERLWEAWTRPEHLRQWMVGPDGWVMERCDVDLRAGGSWRFEWRKDDGAEMILWGRYREVSAPGRLVHTENWVGDWPETLNTLTLTGSAGRTRMELITEYPSRADRDAALGTGMTGGMELSFQRLDRRLEARRVPSH